MKDSGVHDARMHNIAVIYDTWSVYYKVVAFRVTGKELDLYVKLLLVIYVMGTLYDARKLLGRALAC
jgi:hypothetical protein